VTTVNKDQEQHTARRRRIDRILDPAFLDGLEARDAAELRAMRNDCQAEEARLSYQRRLLQGKLDIVRAEAARRGAGDGLGLIDVLPRILADEPTDHPREARAGGMYRPSEDRRGDDDVLAGELSRIPDLDDEGLVTLVTELVQAERNSSELRAEVLRRLDTLQAELIARYRLGGVSLDDILTQPESPTGSGHRS
jgi:hypothetical protein